MKVHRFVTNDFTVRAAAVDATSVVQEMQNLQNTLPLATIGVGRTMVGALLMAAHLKEGQDVGVYLRGNGPLASLYAQATFEGQVRGYCPNPQYQSPKLEDTLDLRKALGFGNLTVSRQQPFQRQPFHGTVEMVSGEVGEDIAHYLHQSHQIRSLVSLGVYLDTYGRVQAAGGVMIEVMPGVEESVVDRLQANYEKYNKPVSKLIVDGQSIQSIVEPFLTGIPFTEIPHDFQIKYACPCTSDRVLSALTVLSLEDLTEMIEDKQKTDVQCQMCGRTYEISTEQLENLRLSIKKNALN